MNEPSFTRFLDTPGLLAFACLHVEEFFEPSLHEDTRRQFGCMSHKQLAAAIGIPSLTVLRKVTGRALKRSRLHQLRELFRERRDLRFLRHARSVSPTLIDALSNKMRSICSNRFLGELCQLRSREQPASGDLWQLIAFMSVFMPDARITSLSHYHRLRNEFDQELREYDIARCKGEHLPPPPWPDEPGYATALRTRTELIAESLAMQNCTGTASDLVRAVEQGMGYFFRIEGEWGMPRATLFCSKSRNDDHWQVDQVAQRRNRPVPSNIVRCLALWLAEKQGIEDEQLCMPDPNAFSCEF